MVESRDIIVLNYLRINFLREMLVGIEHWHSQRESWYMIRNKRLFDEKKEERIDGFQRMLYDQAASGAGIRDQ